MAEPGIFVDTGAVGSASHLLEGAGDLFESAVATFEAGAMQPAARRAFGDLPSMADAAVHYLEMTSATVAVLGELREVLGDDAYRLASSERIYEQADDAGAASAPGAGPQPAGPRVVAVDFGELTACRDVFGKAIDVFTTQIEHVWTAALRLGWCWRGPAADAFQWVVCRWLDEAFAGLADLIGAHQMLQSCVTLFGGAETGVAALWPAIADPAPPAPGHRVGPAAASLTTSWEAAATGIARSVLCLFDLPWPGGVPQDLCDLAGYWRWMAAAMDETMASVADSVSGTVGSSWRGSAADAFAAHVRAQHDHMVPAPANLLAVAAGLEQYAAEVEEIVGTIVKIAMEIVVMIIASRVLGAVTGFLSDLVTSGAIAARVTQIAFWLARLAERADRVGQLLRSGMGAIGKLRTVLETIREAARTELAAVRLSKVGDSLEALSSRLGGAKPRALVTDMAREWRIDFAATLGQQEITTGHVDIGRAALNATGTAAGRGIQLRLEAVSPLLRGWRDSRPLVYAAVSRAILTDLNGAMVDSVVGMDGGAIAEDLMIRPLFAAPRGAFNNHPTLGPRRPGVPLAQTSVERSVLKVAEKVGRVWTENRSPPRTATTPEPAPSSPRFPTDRHLDRAASSSDRHPQAAAARLIAIPVRTSRSRLGRPGPGGRRPPGPPRRLSRSGPGPIRVRTG